MTNTRPVGAWVRRVVRALLLALAVPGALPLAHALTAPEARAIATGDTDTRIAALKQAMQHPDPALATFLGALLDDHVMVDGAAVDMKLSHAGHWVDVHSGAAVTPGPNAESVINNNYLRRKFAEARAALDLLSPRRAVRRRAVREMMATPGAIDATLVAIAAAHESDPQIRAGLIRLQAVTQLDDPVTATRLKAAAVLAGSDAPSIRALLEARLSPRGGAGAETDPAVRAQIQASLARIDTRLAWSARIGLLFSGISLGSILLLAALGLAVTYGLMGVINMAQGEFIMIGAYATYVMQALFQRFLPSASAFALLAAVPFSFVVAGAVGMGLERSLIRRLYGRPLETLLATWGISLVLIQAVRSLFGPENVQVDNPSWMSGGFRITPNLMLSYNRVAIIIFTLVVLLAMWLLISRTRLGLFVRAVTQNRAMAGCLGVRTGRIDMLAFGLGTGIAGLAGCALSQISNVSPDMGANYIVDCFLVVVLGGVGQLSGTVVAALGLGVAETLLEGLAGAVLAKIAVLVAVILFIQKRPQGLFALKGRGLEG